MFPLSKTLAFKLIPVGQTDRNIRNSGILTADEELEQNAIRLKELADDFHKDFIESVLGEMKLIETDNGQLDSIQEYARLIESDFKKDKELEKQFLTVQQSLRRQISRAFTQDSIYPKLDKKELITELLPKRVTGEDAFVLSKFNKFTSYLRYYNMSRMNMYTEDDNTYTIASRVVNDNLPVFYNNLKKYPVIRETLGENTIQQIYRDFEPYLNVATLDEIFTLGYFNLVLTQTQIEVYNSVLNGFNTENGHVPGINHYIHIHNQGLSKGEKALTSLTKLKKQILSDRVKLSWTSKEFQTATDMMQAIQEFHRFYGSEIEKDLRLLLLNIARYNLDGVFIRNDKGLTQISLQNYGRWNSVNEELLQVFSDKVPPRKRSEDEDDFLKRINKYVSNIDSFSITDLDRYMFAHSKPLTDYFTRMGAYESATTQKTNHFVTIANAWTDLYPLLNRVVEGTVKDLSRASDSILVKNYMDAMLELLHFIKPLCSRGDEQGRDTAFYDTFDKLWEQFSQVTNLYNRVRNFMTRKPYTTNKMKLNFGSPTLLDGWSRDKERVNRCCIFRKDGLYYLGILDKTGLDIFTETPTGTPGHCYEKMYYDLFGDAAKMLPKIAFAGKNAGLYQPSEEILRIREQGSYKAGATFNLDDLHKLIDFYKQVMTLNPKWSHVKFPWKETEEYTSIKQFTDDFTGYDYMIEFQPVDADYMHRMVDEGKLHLFQIYNKNFSPYSKGKKSLYTQYFSMLFDPRNMEKVIYKLSGGAEMFFRKASLYPSRPTHPAGLPIENKRPVPGGVPSKSLFKYDLVKDKRYTVDQYMLHLPVSINYSVVEPKGMPVTAKVRQLIREGAFRHIIGIHRGEKNLLYASVIDRNGKLVEQKSLNIIDSDNNGLKISTDYNDLLQRRSNERQQARKDWQTIENIKNIKEGYLGQAVSKITDMILQYDALVVMESLSGKFKNSRMKIEKNIYQKFEKQLVDKLNFLVKKDRDALQPGGILRGYQFTDKSDLSDYQNGIIFYVPSAYTSAICPVTGFVNLFNLHYDKMNTVKSFFGKFDVIRYNPAHNRFEFTFDYTKFTDRAKGSQTQWTISTQGQRVHNYKDNGTWFSEEVNLTNMFHHLFVSHGIDVTGNLKQAIAEVNKRSFYEELVELFNLTVQICNVSTILDEDYLISPVAQEDGTYFRSSAKKTDYPVDTDAGAAYHIALKGSMIIRNIADAAPGEKVRMGITNAEWFSFVQNR